MTTLVDLPRPAQGTARTVVGTHIRVNNTTSSLQTLTAADGDTVSVQPGVTVVEARFGHSYNRMDLRITPVTKDEVSSQSRVRPVTVATLQRTF